MARFLITMLPANDLGLPTRMVPISFRCSRLIFKRSESGHQALRWPDEHAVILDLEVRRVVVAYEDY